MSKIFVVAKNEFCRYFKSPLAFIYLVCFLLLNGSFALYFGGVFTQGNATLRPMFDFLPWILLVFVPGIAMRLWAEEFKSGTVMQIMTLPVSVRVFVWGKFLAAWAFCCLALLLSFPFVITLNVLGNPDNGVIFNSYIGAFLLIGAMLAISQTSSALAKNQVVSLVIAVFANLLFLLSGIEYVLGFFRGFLPDLGIDLISSFSFITHMSLFSSGLAEFRSVVFFVTLIFMFNFFTSVVVNYRTNGRVFWMNTQSLFGCLVVLFLVLTGFLGVNLFADSLLRQVRADWTSEKLFTLSASTNSILKKLPAAVTAKVYYSPILGERDPRMREAFGNLKLLLEIYKQKSNGMFDYKIYNPEPLSDVEDRAIAAGLKALPVSDMNVAAYMGIVFVNENGQSRTLPFLPLQRSGLLEQDLTENIYLLEHKRKKMGFLTSLPILGGGSGGIMYQPWQITNEIAKFYDIKPVVKPQDIEEIDLLLIAHPKEMTKEMEDSIYNFSIKGGKVLAFFDVLPEALYLIGPQATLPDSSEFGGLPVRWGIKFFDDRVVADLENSTQVEFEDDNYVGTVQDLIQFYLKGKSFYDDLPEVKNLKRMLMTSASVFMPLKDANVYFVPLLTSSKESQLLPSMVVTKNIHPAEILRRFKSDNNQKFLAAHVISQQKEKPFEVIVVGDSDLLYDSFWTSSITINNQNYSIPLLDNGNFVLNSLDVLSGNADLLELRGKSPVIRSFEELEKKQKDILRQFRIKEKDVFDQIEFIKNGLQEIQNKKNFEGRDLFTPDELSIIGKIKKDLRQKRLELYDIRKELNSNLEKTEAWVKFFNIYAIPLSFLVIVFLYKNNFKFCVPQKPLFNRRFWWIVGGVGFCILLGFVGVINRPSINDLLTSGQLLFPELSNKINDVSKIKLSGHNKDLELIKKDDLWQIVGQEEFLVNQNRLRSFLTSLVQAEIYEKKADKIENLPRFGLLPISDVNSKATKVLLMRDKENRVVDFEIGNYNIELGRGHVGAYVRRPDKFEIWLALLDVVDLDLDFHNWSYANLWNLQFGRFVAMEHQKNTDILAKFVGVLLNTKLSKTTRTSLKNNILTVNLKGEDFDRLTLSFYQEQKQCFVKYVFEGKITNPVLQKFADLMQNKFYEISCSDMEKIQNVIGANK